MKMKFDKDLNQNLSNSADDHHGSEQKPRNRQHKAPTDGTTWHKYPPRMIKGLR